MFDRLRYVHTQMDVTEPDEKSIASELRTLVADPALATSPVDSRAAVWTGVGSLLIRLHDRSRDGGYLDEAVDVLRLAVEIAPAGSGSYSQARSYLGEAYGLQFGRSQDWQDLVQAGKWSSAAISGLDPDDWRAPVYVLNLARYSARVYAATGKPEPLDAAISALEEAARVRPGSAVQLTAIAGLAELFLERYDLTGEGGDKGHAADGDLDASIGLAEDRLAQGDVGTAGWTRAARALVRARRCRYLLHRRVADLRAAAGIRRELLARGLDQASDQAPTATNAAQ